MREAAEAAAEAIAAHDDELEPSDDPWADLMSELWTLLFDGAIVAIMVACIILMFLYTNASQTALREASGRCV